MFNILYIDDKKENLFALESLLEDFEGIELYLKSSGEDGLKLMLDKRIDLLLLDVQMPIMDGYEVANLLKSVQETADIPIIFITAVFNSTEFRKKGYDLGAVDYLTKPIDDSLLLNKIKVYKKIFDTQAELREKNEYIKSELKFKKKYLKYIFDSSPNLKFVTDGKNIEDANQTMLDFFSYDSVEEFNKEHGCISDFFVDEEGYLQTYMNGIWWIDYMLKTVDFKDNKVVIYNKNIRYVFSIKLREYSYKDKIKYIFDFSDITEYENIKQRYEYAINGASVGLWDWDMVNNSVYFSPKWKEMLGYKNDELKNNFDEWQDRVHPDDLEQALKDIEKSHKKVGLAYTNIHRLRHKDGRWIWILDRGQTYYNNKGEPIRMVGFHTDITDLKELELKLEESKKIFDMFMNNIPYIIIIKDENHKVIYENKIAKIVSKNQNIIGKTATENLGEELGSKVDSITIKAQENGVADDIVEYTIDGKEYIFRALAFAIPQESGKVYVGMIYIDITIQKRLSDELEEQKELMIVQSRHAAMGEMISMIAHQWRQPISVIAMDANNILVDIELESLDIKALKEDVDDIIEQTKHLSKTIDDFRDFFKPNKQKDNILVSDVFNEALLVIEKSFYNNNIEMQKYFEDTSKVEIFSRELLQVFLNILKNAKEALVEKRDKNRKIINKIYEDKDTIIVDIIDNGGGVDVELLDKIFDPYFSTKDEKNGTGLGLYMSKTIIEKHLNGTIKVKNMDDGACFRIKLPKSL